MSGNHISDAIGTSDVADVGNSFNDEQTYYKWGAITRIEFTFRKTDDSTYIEWMRI